MTRTAPGGPVLRLADVQKSFDGVDALKGVTFEARAGEIHALLGENGAGKSTLMAIAAGSLLPDKGLVELGGEPVTGASPLAVRQRGLSIAYQHPALVPDLTVAENTATLFAELRRLAAAGVAVVYITHRLAEVRELCQRVTVLRDGAVRGSFGVAEASDGQLLELIVGRAVTAEFPPKAASTGESVLIVEHFSNRAFHDVTLTAAAGEIVGLAGIVGNGQAELRLALACL